MWIIDGGTASSPFSFADFWHSFLVFVAMFLANKFHDATKPQ